MTDKLYLAHSMTIGQGGDLIGIYHSPTAAVAGIIKTGLHHGPGQIEPFATDWYHFIRVIEVGKTYYRGIWGLPQISNEEYQEVKDFLEIVYRPPKPASWKKKKKQ